MTRLKETGLMFNKGIAVNRLQTSDSFIYACGGSIEYNEKIWSPLAEITTPKARREPIWFFGRIGREP